MSTPSTSTSSARPSRSPGWLIEALDVVEQRRRALLLTVAVVVVAAGAVAVAAPDLLPPTPLVGGAVGVAALLLSLAVLVALDTADSRVRGPRHVRAAGGDLVAVLPDVPEAVTRWELADAIADARDGPGVLMLGIAAAGGDGRRASLWVDAVGRELAGTDLSVLSLDLTGASPSGPGFLEVVQQEAKLAELVALDPDVRFAKLTAGRDTSAALSAFVEAGTWIPRDLDVLLVALPMAASRSVVRASLALNQMLILAERDRTSRVELIAGLDALQAVGTSAQVVLIDDTFAHRVGVAAAAAPGEELPSEPAEQPGEELAAPEGTAEVEEEPDEPEGAEEEHTQLLQPEEEPELDPVPGPERAPEPAPEPVAHEDTDEITGPDTAVEEQPAEERGPSDEADASEDEADDEEEHLEPESAGEIRGADDDEAALSTTARLSLLLDGIEGREEEPSGAGDAGPGRDER